MLRALSHIPVEQGFEQAGAIIIPHHKVGDLLLFLFLGVFAGELRAVTDVYLRLLVLIDQHLEYAHITVDLRLGR